MASRLTTGLVRAGATLRRSSLLQSNHTAESPIAKLMRNPTTRLQSNSSKNNKEASKEEPVEPAKEGFFSRVMKQVKQAEKEAAQKAKEAASAAKNKLEETKDKLEETKEKLEENADAAKKVAKEETQKMKAAQEQLKENKASAKSDDTPKKQQKTKVENTSEEEENVSGPFTKIVDFTKAVYRELILPSSQTSAPYKPPVDRRRTAYENMAKKKQLKPNTKDSGVVLHSDSKWAQQWNDFKENNPVANALFDLRMRFDESDNIMIRAARSITDVVQEKLSGVFEEGDMAQTLEEIHRIDPNFDVHKFCNHIQQNVAPAVIEAYMAGDVAALEGWCAEPCYKVLEAQMDYRKTAGLVVTGKILDLRNVELMMGKVMEQGPVLLFTFQTQQVVCVRDASGAIKEGSEDSVVRAIYSLAMRRDQSVFDPLAAWQVLELQNHGSTETW